MIELPFTLSLASDSLFAVALLTSKEPSVLVE